MAASSSTITAMAGRRWRSRASGALLSLSPARPYHDAGLVRLRFAQKLIDGIELFQYQSRAIAAPTNGHRASSPVTSIALRRRLLRGALEVVASIPGSFAVKVMLVVIPSLSAIPGPWCRYRQLKIKEWHRAAGNSLHISRTHEVQGSP